MGTCMRERAGEPHKRTRVPWMSEWIRSSSESRRKAGVESVERVKGRKMRICRTVESLVRSSADC